MAGHPTGQTHPRHLLGVVLALGAGGHHVLLQLCLQMGGVLPHLDTHTRTHVSEASSGSAGGSDHREQTGSSLAAQG